MTREPETDHLARPYEELKDRPRATDRDAAIKAYYELLSSGRPLDEIIRGGAPRHSGKGDPEADGSIQLARVLRPPVSPSASKIDEEPGPLLDRFKSGSRRKLVLSGSIIGVCALVTSIALVANMSLHKRVFLPERRAPDTAVSGGKSASPSSAKPRPAAALAPSPVVAPAKPAQSSSRSTAAAIKPVPPPAINAAYSPRLRSAVPPKPTVVPVHPTLAPQSKTTSVPDHLSPAATPAPKPLSAAVSASAVTAPGAVPDGSARTAIEAGDLISRGDALLGIGDLTSARLFYQRGANLGDGTAALRLGETFDPGFLRQAGLGRVAGDPKRALYWYHRASRLGDRDADVLAKGLAPAKR